jgi:hypothetical protein
MKSTAKKSLECKGALDAIALAGSPDFIDIPIFKIEEIVYGKYN